MKPSKVPVLKCLIHHVELKPAKPFYWYCPVCAELWNNDVEKKLATAKNKIEDNERLLEVIRASL